jgi:NitT/TauT family transport system ATP-binding protein
MIEVKINNWRFVNSVENIIDRIYIQFNENLIYTIIGPSGGGKTTFLNLISRLLENKNGIIKIDKDKQIGYMFQEDILLPWRSLIENIELGIDVLNLVSHELYYYIDAFDLNGYENYYPHELSGGMKQRAALIRTLLPNPDILLLDEPFSNLDFDIKLRIQKYILDYQRKTKCLIILVTHDIEDAIALSDKVIIFTEKPTKIKKVIDIDNSMKEKDPIEARKSPEFSKYFKEIWNELKYNNIDALQNTD